MSFSAHLLWGLVAVSLVGLARGNGRNSGIRSGSGKLRSRESGSTVEAMSSTVSTECTDISACNEASSKLLEASRKGDLSEVKRHLSLGANVETRDENGASAFYWAMMGGHLSVGEELISAGADVNARDISGWSPLHWASFYGKKNLGEMLIKIGVNVGEATVKAQTRQWGYWKRMYYSGSTPLDISATNGHLEFTQLLLDHDALNKSGDAARGIPLHVASKYGHSSVVQALVDAGADTNKLMGGSWTALHFAADYEVAKVLLDAGADPNVEDGNGATPLLNAGTRGHFGPAKALIAAGAEINTQNNFGWTPLHAFANDCTSPEALETLISAGGDVEAKAHDNSTPLYALARLSTRRENLDECMKILVTAGADINVKGSAGWTPLHWAAYNGDVKLIEGLLAKGGHIGARSTTGIHYYRYKFEYYYHQGSTPLHISALNGNVQAVKDLLEHGADKEEQNQDGFTPRDIVPEHADDREYLLELLA